MPEPQAITLTRDNILRIMKGLPDINSVEEGTGKTYLHSAVSLQARDAVEYFLSKCSVAALNAQKTDELAHAAIHSAAILAGREQTDDRIAILQMIATTKGIKLDLPDGVTASQLFAYAYMKSTKGTFEDGTKLFADIVAGKVKIETKTPAISPVEAPSPDIEATATPFLLRSHRGYVPVASDATQAPPQKRSWSALFGFGGHSAPTSSKANYSH